MEKSESISFFSQPNYTWRFQFSRGYWWNVQEGFQPNAFHRLMQRVLLGIKWERI